MNFKKAHVAAFKAHKAVRSILQYQYSYGSSVWSDASSGNTLKSGAEVGVNGRSYLRKQEAESLMLK